MRLTDPRLRAHLAPARGPLVGVVVASTSSALLVIGQAFVLAAFLVAALTGGDWPRWGLALVAVLLGRALAGLVVDVYAARAAAVVGAGLRRSLLLGVLDRPTGTRSTGEVATLATRGVDAAEPYLTRYLPAFLLAMVLPVLAVVATATQDVLSSVIELATLPLIPVFGALVGLATRDRAEKQWRALASLSGHFVDVMRGLPTLVAFRRATAQSATIRQVTHRYRRATLDTLRIAFASSAVLELVATLSVALVAVTVGVRLAAGHLDLRTALVVLLLAPEAYWPLRKVGAEFHAAAEGGATFEEISAEMVPATGGSAIGAGAIQLSGLSVVYDGRRVPALDRLDATMPDRGLTVVTGPSGCGKSTLLSAVMGLVEPAAGRITVGGVDVAGPAWQAQLSWLPQRPMFLAGSIADNVRLGAPQASDLGVWSALREVGLADRVAALPGGIDSPVGEDARLLSAGERARLALARVVASDRPWVLLDEPTAHLDELSERIITKTLTRLSRDRAVVVVSHRPAVLRQADHVVGLSGGSRAPGTVARRTIAGPSWPSAWADLSTGSDKPIRSGFVIASLLAAAASLSGAALTATAGWLIVKAAEHPPVLTMLVAIVGVRTFGLARPALRYVERLRSHDQALRLLAERRVQVYDAVVPLTPGALGRRRGDVLASIVDDVESVVDQQLRVRMPVRSGLLVMLVASAVAAWLLPAAGVVVALTGAVGAGLAWSVAAYGSRRAAGAAVQARAMLAAGVVELVQLAPELVMWQAQEPAVAGVLRRGREVARARVAAATALGFARAMVLLTVALGMLAMTAVTASAVVEGRLSGPMLALLVLTPLALVDVLVAFADAGAISVAARAADQRLQELEQRAPAVRPTADTQPLPPGSDLRIRDLRLGWPGTDVIAGLDLSLPAGTRLGVVGPSGSGKSTLGAALMRFVDPVGGRIELDAVPFDRLDPDDVRRTVGLVDDDPHVFASTLAANLRLARPSASDDDLVQALAAAHLDPWFAGLPDGLDTWLGDGHAQVSGGERARLALARSVLADPPVLVLDEPTAHLDLATAEGVTRDLLDGAQGRTVVWITHEDVGLDRMDQVLRLGHEGRPGCSADR